MRGRVSDPYSRFERLTSRMLPGNLGDGISPITFSCNTTLLHARSPVPAFGCLVPKGLSSFDASSACAASATSYPFAALRRFRVQRFFLAALVFNGALTSFFGLTGDKGLAFRRRGWPLPLFRFMQAENIYLQRHFLKTFQRFIH